MAYEKVIDDSDIASLAPLLSHHSDMLTGEDDFCPIFRWSIGLAGRVIASYHFLLQETDELGDEERGSGRDRKSTRLNSSHVRTSRMPSSAWKKKY